MVWVLVGYNERMITAIDPINKIHRKEYMMNTEFFNFADMRMSSPFLSRKPSSLVPEKDGCGSESSDFSEAYFYMSIIR